MKNYYLFLHPEHEASGGWRDLVGAFEIIEECKEYLKKHKRAIEEEDYLYHIVEISSMRIIEEGRSICKYNMTVQITYCQTKQ